MIAKVTLWTEEGGAGNSTELDDIQLYNPTECYFASRTIHNLPSLFLMMQLLHELVTCPIWLSNTQKGYTTICRQVPLELPAPPPSVQRVTFAII